jgi:hypothetical protein
MNMNALKIVKKTKYVNVKKESKVGSRRLKMNATASCELDPSLCITRRNTHTLSSYKSFHSCNLKGVCRTFS